MTSGPTFHCVVLTPRGKVLDCKTPSVILPAHDGKVGIWRNHMPMLVELGLGIMEVKAAVCQKDQEPCDIFMLIDTGFARVNSNQVMVLAYEAIKSDEIPLEKIEEMAAKTRNGDHSLARKEQKAKMLTQLAKIALIG